MSKRSSDYNGSVGNNTDMLVEQLMTALDTATKVARQLKNATRKGKSGRSSVVKSNSGMSNSGMSNSDPSNSGMSNSGMSNSDPSNSGPSNSGMDNLGLSNSTMNTGNNNNFNSKKRAQNNSMRTQRVKPLSNNRSTTSKKNRSKLNEPSLNF